MNADAHLPQLRRESVKPTHSVIRDAITARLGAGWSGEDLRDRLVIHRLCGPPQELFVLDGKPLIEVWPAHLEAVMEGGKFIIKASLHYRTFTADGAPVKTTSLHEP